MLKKKKRKRSKLAVPSSNAALSAAQTFSYGVMALGKNIKKAVDKKKKDK